MTSDETEHRQGNHESTFVFALLVVAISLVVIAVFLVYVLVAIWPSGSSIQLDSHTRSTFLGMAIAFSGEQRLIVLVAAAGGLGGTIPSLRSLILTSGSQNFKSGSLPYFYLTPVSGGVLSLVFYFVIRGAFVPTSTRLSLDPYGFVTAAALTGFFATQLTARLSGAVEAILQPLPEQVAESIEAKLLGPPLDNYEGFASLTFFLDGTELVPTAEGSVQLPSQTPIDLQVEIAASPGEGTLYEPIRITNGRQNEHVVFDIRPEGEAITFLPKSQEIKLKGQNGSGRVTFSISIDSRSDALPMFVHIMQHNRLVQLVRVTGTVPEHSATDFTA